MKISIIQNDKPKLPLCKMNCDEKLGEHLERYELTKFMNNHSVNLLIGNLHQEKPVYYIHFLRAEERTKYLEKFSTIYSYSCQKILKNH